MSSTPTKYDFNIETGQETVIELTQEEIGALNLAEQEAAVARSNYNAAKISAIEKLKEIGLTEEEISALIGY